MNIEKITELAKDISARQESMIRCESNIRHRTSGYSMWDLKPILSEENFAKVTDLIFTLISQEITELQEQIAAEAKNEK